MSYLFCRSYVNSFNSSNLFSPKLKEERFIDFGIQKKTTLFLRRYEFYSSDPDNQFKRSVVTLTSSSDENSNDFLSML